MFDRVETLLLLRLKPLRIEPSIEELRASHTGFPVGIIGDITCGVCFKRVRCVIDIIKVLSLT